MIERCWQCGGDGGWHDCGEDCCACLGPDDDDEFWVECDICDGDGYLIEDDG